MISDFECSISDVGFFDFGFLKRRGMKGLKDLII
jgi:hypothetical protein